MPEDKIPDISNLATKTILNTNINEFKNNISSITGVARTSALTPVENKIPSVTNFVKKVIIIQRLVRLKKDLLIMLMINILPPQNLIT